MQNDPASDEATVRKSTNVTGNATISYVASCPEHNWEGMWRETYSEAQLDLTGHVELFPDESHASSGVEERL